MTAPRLAADGYFYRGDTFLPLLGANYWPGSCGVDMWLTWPEAEIQADLDLMNRLGLNCIRFFVRWQDFEPEEGVYDDQKFDRLTQFLAWCDDRDILAQPSLFVGWMSGGEFWPAWRAGRNVFADPLMVERGAAFASRCAAAIAPFHHQLFGVDLGNELNCLNDSHAASPAKVEQWCATISAAVRDAYPDALIVSGCEHGQVVGDSGWRFGQETGTDYYSMHAYPVPAWHPVSFDGLTDPLAQSLLPFYTQCAKAFGPVLVQEFGTIVTGGASQQDSYLRGMLPACWAAGGNGFLWWCLRDITARVHPYVKNGFEGTLGLVDAAGNVKPGLEYFIEFGKSLTSPPPASAKPTVGLYWPKHYYLRDEPTNPGNDPRTTGARMVAANYLLRELGYNVAIIRGDLPLPASGVIVVASALLDIDEAAALAEWVTAGGKLVWHGPDPVNWGPDYQALVGAVAVDYRAPLSSTVTLRADTYTFQSFARGFKVQVEERGAAVLATDEHDVPMVLRHSLGSGCVVTAIPVVEDAFLAVSGRRGDREIWASWYRSMLEIVTSKKGASQKGA
ncbi:MAG TPA: cellulase family glycosylhydrolase [Capsulimonadaceae bacterium]|jgi:hypothetical protein